MVLRKLVDDDETYMSVVGGTAKRARFESAKNTREERKPENASKQRDNYAICTDESMREYLDTVTAAATAKEERMQEMTCAAKAKDNQLTEMMARLD